VRDKICRGKLRRPRTVQNLDRIRRYIYDFTIMMEGLLLDKGGF
jgi:hypothetical protein